jgi:hypothetical protein
MSFEHIILPAECFPPGARLDWFNDHAQILVDEQGQEEPAVCVRYWPDGSVAEIRIRRDLMSKGIVCAEDTMKLSHWQNTRDRICP